MQNAEGRFVNMASKYTKQGFYEGIKELDARLKRALLHGSWAMRDAARELAKMGENEVKTSISKPGSYKKYWKNGKKKSNIFLFPILFNSVPGTRILRYAHPIPRHLWPRSRFK